MAIPAIVAAKTTEAAVAEASKEAVAEGIRETIAEQLGNQFSQLDSVTQDYYMNQIASYGKEVGFDKALEQTHPVFKNMEPERLEAIAKSGNISFTRDIVPYIRGEFSGVLKDNIIGGKNIIGMEGNLMARKEMLDKGALTVKPEVHIPGARIDNLAEFSRPTTFSEEEKKNGKLTNQADAFEPGLHAFDNKAYASIHKGNINEFRPQLQAYKNSGYTPNLSIQKDTKVTSGAYQELKKIDPEARIIRTDFKLDDISKSFNKSCEATRRRIGQ